MALWKSHGLPFYGFIFYANWLVGSCSQQVYGFLLQKNHAQHSDEKLYWKKKKHRNERLSRILNQFDLLFLLISSINHLIIVLVLACNI